jgi:hypothetical protein
MIRIAAALHRFLAAFFAIDHHPCMAQLSPQFQFARQYENKAESNGEEETNERCPNADVWQRYRVSVV